MKLLLTMIISGGQNGADVAGLRAAKRVRLKTGGLMPKGFRTLDGPRPKYAELYGMVEHESRDYPPRTFENVRVSDATIRLARNFSSAGERCTLRAIEKYGKPYIDVACGPMMNEQVGEVIEFIRNHNPVILNIAGNSENTCRGIGNHVEQFLVRVFTQLGFKEQGK